MLQHLTISNYAITDHLDLEFKVGMTVITGETGAGKSITLDALALALGDRADSRSVGKLADRAEITATFSVANNARALAWLKDRELVNGADCLLRRVVSREGKSRAFINSTPSTLQDLRQLGELLIDIHGQHEHQSLLRREAQRDLLDDYADSRELAEQVQTNWQQWKERSDHLQRLQSASADESARIDLLRYQLRELTELGLSVHELEALESEQRSLANAEDILASCHKAAALCQDEESGISHLLNRAHQLLLQLPERTSALANAMEMLDSASIQVQEVETTLNDYLSSFDADPGRLQEVERRLDDIYTLARKYRVTPDKLPVFSQQLQAELDSLDSSDDRIQALQAELDACAASLAALASQLSAARHKAATSLQRDVNKQLKSLRMENCTVTFALPANPQVTAHGLESVSLEVSTNPGQPAASIARVASGGELSRIGLAIQVAAAKTAAIPCLVFDEIDAGVGGAVAEVVGKLLRRLGDGRQVMCVTHLPQVAAQAHHHFQVSKSTGSKKSVIKVEVLEGEEKVAELARMLGGINITEQTLAHAREMLAG